MAVIALIIAIAAASTSGFGYYTQQQKLSDIEEKLDTLGRAQSSARATADKRDKEAQKRLDDSAKIVAELQATLTATQNRLSDDEKKLSVTQQRLPPDLVKLAAEASPAVVTIGCGAGSGSGFALDLDPDPGYTTVIVTAAHVVADCADANSGSQTDSITVLTHSQRTLSAHLQAVDQDNDVATIEVKGDLPALEPADHEPEPGEFVMVIGTPLGLVSSVTQGNVSKVETEFFTHSASISNGNSGGPLIDREGRVLGVVKAAVTASDDRPVVENLNIAIRLLTLCSEALSGPVCQTLH